MTARRLLTVLTLTCALVLGGSLAASAAFQDAVQVRETAISTATITAPTGVSATRDSCPNGHWMDVTVTWQRSSSTRISGYAVTAYRNDGQVFRIGTTGPGSTSLSTTVDKLQSSSTSVHFTVTTLTDYGWDAESVRWGAITC